ncbi:histidine phosphatase family protein [Tabrizicola sp. BL-A-41-H6]|uniref:histidine phosphatase family protein n=1 Tax=Tabrizicola sp. BL-A-41-H6 TaxID=3421107 RepID=UPI003D67B2ED
MTRFWWVRHGPTHETAFTGWRDVPADLSDTPRLQRLAAALPHAPVIASDLIRASATADALAPGRPRLPDTPALRELHFGDWDGKHWSEVAATHPDLSRRYWEEPSDHAPPNGESWNQATIRISSTVDELLATHRNSDLILVAHFGAILTQLARARGFDVARAFQHKIDTLSVTRLAHDGTGWTAEVINHSP